jgi:hypothetical protein
MVDIDNLKKELELAKQKEEEQKRLFEEQMKQKEVDVVKDNLQQQIEIATRKFISEVAPESVFSILSVMRMPSTAGAKERLAAAKDLLDRAGFVKTDKVEVNTNGGLFILPAKEGSPEND